MDYFASEEEEIRNPRLIQGRILKIVIFTSRAPHSQPIETNLSAKVPE